MKVISQGVSRHPIVTCRPQPSGRSRALMQLGGDVPASGTPGPLAAMTHARASVTVPAVTPRGGHR